MPPLPSRRGGKIEIAERTGRSIPKGWVIKEDGSLATNSTNLLKEMNEGKAALLPLGGSGELMGGHKGYGLATIVEILSAAFQDGAYLSELDDKDKQGNPHPSRIGHFFLAINIENFVPLDHFRKTAEAFCGSCANPGWATGRFIRRGRMANNLTTGNNRTRSSVAGRRESRTQPAEGAEYAPHGIEHHRPRPRL